MTLRHRAREVALQVLYRYDVGAQGANPPAGPDLAMDIKRHFDHFQVTEQLREFSALLISGTLHELPALDALIEKNASNWKVARMPLIDRMLLRMATYELMHISDTPATVVINEAVELAKEFGTAETPAFVNGVLDSIRRNEKEKAKD